MRIVIDGYNLLHAVMTVPAKLAPGGLHRLRQRLLNELAHRLGPMSAAETIVVFDSRGLPDQASPSGTTHKGLKLIFAAGDDGADAAIERLIAMHSAPTKLTVVSTDRRIRQAARRRKARTLTADEFWSSLSTRRPKPPPPMETPPPPATLSREESAYWQEQFRDVLDSPEAREIGRRSEGLPTDEEIARIEREVAEESDPF